jgi:hypothetical protein
VTRKKSKDTFNAGVEARRAARNAAGSPPAGKIITDKRRKPPKHKKRLIDSELN